MTSSMTHRRALQEAKNRKETSNSDLFSFLFETTSMQQEAAAAAAAPAEHNQRGGRARAWVFTWNNFSHENLFPDGIPADIKYVIYQSERGAAGTPHLQGYIVFTSAKSLQSVRKIDCKAADGTPFRPFEHAHLDIARGSADDNKKYCTKADTRVNGPWELGAIPVGQGARTDLKDTVEKLLESGGDLEAIDPVMFVKHTKGLMSLISDRVVPPRRDNLKVITIVGKTGIGKSYAIHDLYPNISLCSWGNSGAWFHGYHGQRVIAFEEFRGQIQLQRLLQYLDVYGVYLELKFGSFPCRATVIFITSNSEPHEWYNNDAHVRDEQLNALYRRLGYVPAGSPEARAGQTSSIRYIKADTRDELHKKLDLVLAIADLEPKPEVVPWHPVPVAAPAAFRPPAAAAGLMDLQAVIDENDEAARMIDELTRQESPSGSPPAIRRAGATVH